MPAEATSSATVFALRDLFTSDPTGGRAADGAWDQAWKKSITPWDNAGVQPALKELVETSWSEVGIDWSSLEGGRAIVPGCGRARRSGYDAIYFASKGLDSWGVDLSPTAIAAAEAHYATQVNPPTNVEFKALDFFAFLIPSGGFSLAYDYTFLCALPPSLRFEWGTRYADLVKPGGVLIALMYPLDGDRVGGPPYSLSPELYGELLSANFERVYCELPKTSAADHIGREKMSVWRRK